MLSERELDALVERCRAIPLAPYTYLATELVPTLLETVIDYQQQTATVSRAVGHFRAQHADSIRTFDELEATLPRFPDDPDGNAELALFLWGYRFWTRAEQLRGLVGFFGSLRVTTLVDLQEWARTSTFETDFKGKVKGLGIAVYHALLMRLGVDTVKPDVHVLRFIGDAIGRKASEVEAIEALREAAKVMHVPATQLDWSIWEFGRTQRPSSGPR
jgi:hypothetical protein